MNESGSQTVGTILESLGYADPMDAARQQGRMILLGRIAHYQAAIQQFQQQRGVPFEEMQARYEAQGVEDFDEDDLYLEWHWFRDALERAEAQLAALSAS